MEGEIAEKQAELSKIEVELKEIELTEDVDDDELDDLIDDSEDLQREIGELNQKIADAQRAALCLPQDQMDPETYRQYATYQDNLETVTRMWSEARSDRDTAQSMLTALSELNDKVNGFNIGVDDYLVKPFEIEELKARVLALLNRSGQEMKSLRVKEVLSKGDITLIPESYSVQIIDKTTRLTPIEFDILYTLMQHEGAMVSSKELLKEIWGYDDNDIDTIRVHITHLRNKINKISSEKNKQNITHINK